MSKTIEIKISSILEDLKNGYTRIKSDKNHDPKIGSIQDKYGLNRIQVFELFKHEKLKGKKTIIKKEPAFTIIDDTNGEEVTTVLVKDLDAEEDADWEKAGVVEVEASSALKDEEKTEEVSTPDTQTLTGMDDPTEEAKADSVETDDQGESWL